MEPASDLILGYLANTLDQATRAEVEARLADDPQFAQRLERVRFAVATVRIDAADPVPASAVATAKALGQRLVALRPPSVFEQLSNAARALVATLVFDSRLEGSLAGLRGGSGFAVIYAAGPVEVELECDAVGPDRFGILGQLAGSDAARVEVFAEVAAAGNRVAEAPIDSDGMFRLELASGHYLLRFHTTGGPIDVADIDVP